MPEPLDLLADLIGRARAAGADAADAVLLSGTSIGVRRRLRATEHVERSEGRDLGLRVFLGQRAAIVSSSTIDPASFKELAERAVAMARVVPEDPYAGLADTAEPPDSVSLDLVDPAEPSTEALIARASTAEEAALAVSGVTNSEGAEASFGRTEAFLVTSAGFAGHLAHTRHSVSATALAGTGTDMQRDYDYHTTIHLTDLDDPTAIGHSAGARAVARLHPIRAKTAKLPIVYDPRVAGSLLGHLAGAINGASVARGTTFLKDPGAVPSVTLGLRWTSDDGRDDLNLVADAINGGQWGYNNLQWYGAVYYHKLNDYWHIAFETYNLHENNVPNLLNPTAAAIVAGGGTPFSPQFIPFNAPNAAQCNSTTVLTCTASTQTFLTYVNYSPNKLNNFSMRLEWYDDMEGQRTGTKTRYLDVAGSWQHWLSPQVELRPEIAYYRSLDAPAFDGNANGGIPPSRNYSVIGAADIIWHF